MSRLQLIDVIWSKLHVEPAEEEVILVEHDDVSPEDHKRMEVNR